MQHTWTRSRQRLQCTDVRDSTTLRQCFHGPAKAFGASADSKQQQSDICCPCGQKAAAVRDCSALLNRTHQQSWGALRVGINIQRGFSYSMQARGKQLARGLLWAGDLQEGYRKGDIDTCTQLGAVNCATRAVMTQGHGRSPGRSAGQQPHGLLEPSQGKPRNPCVLRSQTCNSAKADVPASPPKLSSHPWSEFPQHQQRVWQHMSAVSLADHHHILASQTCQMHPPLGCSCTCCWPKRHRAGYCHIGQAERHVCLTQDSHLSRQLPHR